MTSQSTGARRAPSTDLVHVVAGVWSEVLGISPIESTDTLKDLGGTSLDAERILARLRLHLTVRLDADLLVGAPTVEEVAAGIEERRRRRFAEGPSTCTVLRTGADDRPTLFCFAGAGATSAGFVPLVDTLPADVPVVSFQAHGLESRGIPDWTVGRAAARHLRVVARRPTNGPYFLVGHSFGGHVAAEVARRLVSTGARVGGVYLLDTVLSPIGGGSVADYGGTASTPPSVLQRLRTHLRLLGAGLVPYDTLTQQSVFWEQAVRVQNRHRVRSMPTGATVFVTDQNAGQEQLWRAVPPGDTRVIRVGGDHLSVLSSPTSLAAVREVVLADMAADRARS